MGKVTVIASFTLCLFFNVFLKTLDVYSDTALAYKTLTFNLGNSLLLSGCRVCHDKEDIDVFTSVNRACQQCVTVNKNFQCGNSFKILDKIHEFQQGDTCGGEHINLKWTLKTEPLEVEFYIDENTTCDPSRHFCCFKNVKNAVDTIQNGPLDNLDKRIVAFSTKEMPQMKNFLDYETFVLSGQISNWYCQKLITKEYDIIWKYVSSQIKSKNPTVSRTNKSEYYFKLSRTSEGTINIENGFSYKDECGMLITSGTNASNNGENTCKSDSCLVHLQSLKYNFNITSLDNWRKETFFEYGRKLGGKTCHLLRIYGIGYLVPIVVTLIFNALVFFEELKTSTTSKFEGVFVVLQFYPQWKTIRFLYEYLCYKNEVQLNNSRKYFDATLGGLEPYLEAAFQVRKITFS